MKTKFITYVLDQSAFIVLKNGANVLITNTTTGLSDVDVFQLDILIFYEAKF